MTLNLLVLQTNNKHIDELTLVCTQQASYSIYLNFKLLIYLNLFAINVHEIFLLPERAPSQGKIHTKNTILLNKKHKH